jgi:hypothetical protein
MSLWDSCIDSDDEKIEEVFIGDTTVIKSAPKDYNLREKGIVSNISSSTKTNTPLRKITPPITTSKPSTSSPITSSDKSNTIFPSNNNKYGIPNLSANNTKPDNPKTISKDKNPQSNTKTNKPEMCALEYIIIQDMRKTKDNISMYDICTLPQQRDLLIDTFNANNCKKKDTAAIDNSSKTTEVKSIHTVEINATINATSIGAYSRS